MTIHAINDSQEEKLIQLAEKENTTVENIIQKAIDAYYMNQTNINVTLQEIRKQNEKQLVYLQSLSILKNNYESIKEVNDSINDFMNN